MFASLTKNISNAFDNFRSKKTLNENDIASVIQDIKSALLDADVELNIAKDFCHSVSQKALGAEILKDVNPQQMFIKIVEDEITNILSSDQSELQLNQTSKEIILMVGLQGSGKTTSTAKLAKYLQDKKNKKILVASTDIYRPAAKEQLEIMAQKSGCSSLEIIAKEKPEKTVKRALKALKKSDYDLLLIDTAGRLSIDKELIKELKSLHKISNPIETLLVADSLTGQDAVNTARNFQQEIDLTGIILTRIDGDQRGGAALSMKQALNIPIKFMGVGEKTTDFEEFQAKRISSRILDMGDIVSLVEKAQEVVDEDEAKTIEQKFRQGKFDLDDLLKQIKNMKKMGGFGSVLGMLPGAGKLKDMVKNANIDDKEFTYQEAIILSMTKYEKLSPDKLNTSRKRRIAKGSGTSVQQVNRLLKKFKDMQKMMHKMRNMDPNQLMEMMGQGRQG
jgi:signal recognition particle subunit SRP54